MGIHLNIFYVYKIKKWDIKRCKESSNFSDGTFKEIQLKIISNLILKYKIKTFY